MGSYQGKGFQAYREGKGCVGCASIGEYEMISERVFNIMERIARGGLQSFEVVFRCGEIDTYSKLCLLNTHNLVTFICYHHGTTIYNHGTTVANTASTTSVYGSLYILDIKLTEKGRAILAAHQLENMK
jgi:hypothetical protein